MSIHYFNRFKKRLGDCARQHYLHLPWSMGLNTLELSTLFTSLEQASARAGVHTQRVNIGHKVTLFDVREKEIIVLTLTNPRDSDPHSGFISCFSPLGRQLIGRMPGDLVEVKIFMRTLIFRVIRIEH